jgi:hypothetical protein
MEAANEDGKEVSAHALADFWIRSVRIAAGNEHLHKKSTFDTCLTLYKRLFSIPECEAVAANEEKTWPGLRVAQRLQVARGRLLVREALQYRLLDGCCIGLDP